MRGSGFRQMCLGERGDERSGERLNGRFHDRRGGERAGRRPRRGCVHAAGVKRVALTHAHE